MPGWHEILIIVLVAGGIMLIPRMTARGSRRMRTLPTPRRRFRDLRGVSGRLRLGMLISLAWVLLSAGFTKPWTGAMTPFFYTGLVPVLLGWGIVWVWVGFKARGPRR